ncbi:hypothetical protein TIFTF001_039183 [Ficus carica]|uniref:Uncharacterized protein n=1 Tax=Ficus carica TaxID=3494 RepID=A0AA88E9C4_FICCA|nr:hypothetical protein TIFTF001_039183 [Ficus carica]
MVANNTGLSADNNMARRRGYCDYPPIWSFDYIQSIKSEYAEGEGAYASQRDKLKDEVWVMLKEITDPLVQLETIDILQRLGIFYLFEDEIKSILEGIYNANDFDSGIWKDNLYATALKFRLLRQHPYSVPQEIFNGFKDESGKFKESIGNDVKGLLSLHEASFLLMHGENILDEARELTTKHLQEFAKQNEDESYLSKLVGHALKVPLHWRVPRLEARWFIELYKKSPEIMNPTFLKLSILDYNIVQSKYQEELKRLSRERITKLFKLISVMDDTYDVYGTMDELELFTTAIESWDLNAMDQLPEYLKILFLAVYNFTNELAYDILKEQGFHIIKYLKKLWEDLSKAYFQEAKWYHTGTRPASVEEYMENAWLSVAGPIVLVFAYVVVTNPITEAGMELVMRYPSIIHQYSLIIRLTNDLATDSFEKKNGDAPTIIQCYMHETGASEDEARKHTFFLVTEAWKQLNEDKATNFVLSRTYVELVVNLSRITMWMYEGRDGYGLEYRCRTRDFASSVDLIFLVMGFKGMISGNDVTGAEIVKRGKERSEKEKLCGLDSHGQRWSRSEISSASETLPRGNIEDS